MNNVIVLVEYFYPGTKAGGPINSVINLTRNLGLSESLNFHIYCSAVDKREPEVYKNIVKNKPIKSDRYTVIYFESVKLLIESIAKILRKDKIFYLNSFFSLRFSILPLILFAVFGRNEKIILAPRGELTNGALSLKSAKKRIYVRLFKIFLNQKKLIFHATDKSELLEIKALGLKNEIRIASNLPSQIILDNVVRVPKTKNTLRLIYVSRVVPKKNLIFLLNLLMKCDLEFSLEIIGNIEDKKYFDDCSRIIENIRRRGNDVIVQGHRERDFIIRRLINSDLFVLPTLNENYGHAIVEAMKSKCPLLISDNTPWSALREKDSLSVLSLGSIEDWHARLALMCAMNESEWRSRSDITFKFAQEAIDIESIQGQYRSLFEV